MNENAANDESDAYALITRLIEARNVLTMAAQHIAEHNSDAQLDHGQHRAIDELDQAMVHITLAIEAL